MMLLPMMAILVILCMSFPPSWKQKNPHQKNKMVFLSYTIKDKEAVENLKKAIETINNVTCWYDNREIVPGDDFKTEIAKNIKSADLFIPLISANSLNA